jgi:hypothetical protein
MMSDLITQEDREAAALLMIDLGGFDHRLDSKLREGKWDEHAAVTSISEARRCHGDADAIKELFDDALNEWGAAGYGRDTLFQTNFTAVVSKLRSDVLAKLATTATSA